MNTVTINGVTYQSAGSLIVTSKNGRVEVNGETIISAAFSPVEIRVIEGTIDTLCADGNVHCGDVMGTATSGGSMTADSVGGDVSAGGSVRCGTVAGSINAGGSVHHSR